MKILISMFLAIYSLNLCAQEAREVKVEQDGIVITFEISDLKGKRAEEGPQELCIFLKNNNEHSVQINFTLAFFVDGLVSEESAAMELCAAAGKELKGKKLGLCWLISEENYTKIQEDNFDWTLNDLTVEKVESCK